jgi:hypothetical protein
MLAVLGWHKCIFTVLTKHLSIRFQRQTSKLNVGNTKQIVNYYLPKVILSLL